MENWEKSILHANEFSQMTLTVVKNIVDKEVINVNNIHFDQLCNELINRTKVTAEDEILMLAIPTAARPHVRRHEKVDEEDTSPLTTSSPTQPARNLAIITFDNMKRHLQQHRKCAPPQHPNRTQNKPKTKPKSRGDRLFSCAVLKQTTAFPCGSISKGYVFFLSFSSRAFTRASS